MAIKTKAYDLAKRFSTEEAQIDLISDALETGHVGYIAAALGTVAKARGMSEIADGTGLNRQALYGALSEGGNPTLDTVMKVLDALGLQLSAQARALDHA